MNVEHLHIPTFGGIPMDDYDIRDAGSGPLIGALCDAFDLENTINNSVTWDEKQCKISPGTHVKALIISILSKRVPLYKIEKYYREQDLELLFGPGITADDFNDDVLGRTLDKVYIANPKKVFCNFALKAVTKEDIDLSILHGDTTSRLVYGQYEGEGSLNITYGRSKDKRPDLKQYLWGLVTTRDGVPVFGEVKDGNLDDKTWNQELLPQLAEQFQPEQLSKIIYVSDSAIVHKTCLEQIKSYGLKFISRLPHTFNLADQLIEKAWDKDQWTDIGSLVQRKKSAEYRCFETQKEIYGHKYRFIVVHSSVLDKRKLKSLTKRLEKQKAELEKAIKAQMKKEYACEPDAEKAMKRFFKDQQNPFYPLSGEIVKEQVQIKRSKPGRPSAKDIPSYEEVYRTEIELGTLDQQAFAKEQERLSCFVLISNIWDTEYTGEKILEEYKRQHTVENKFKFIKNPVYIGPIYIQKKERLEALSYVILMALLIYSILERRVRQALQEETEPLILSGNVKSFEPTGNRILELLDPVKVLHVDDGGRVKRFLPKRYYDLSRVLKFAGFDLEIYQRSG